MALVYSAFLSWPVLLRSFSCAHRPSAHLHYSPFQLVSSFGARVWTQSLMHVEHKLYHPDCQLFFSSYRCRSRQCDAKGVLLSGLCSAGMHSFYRFYLSSERQHSCSVAQAGLQFQAHVAETPKCPPPWPCPSMILFTDVPFCLGRNPVSLC